MKSEKRGDGEAEFRAEDPDACVRRILINVNHRRFRKRRVEEHPGDAPAEPAVTDGTAAFAQRDALVAALMELPPKQRAVVVLRYWDGLTETQAATVNPTPFTSGKGQFSGTVDGKKWSVAFDNVNCYYIPWSCGFTGLYPWDKYASLTGSGNYVLFLALPSGLGVSKIELFDSHDAEIAYSLPFNLKGAASAAAQWYKPGQKPPTFSGSVEIMHSDGDPEGAVSAYVGPSGPCVVTNAGGVPIADCDPLFGPVAGSLDVQSPVVTSAGGAKSFGATSGYGLAAPNVTRMQIDFADGTKSPVSIKSLGGYRFYVFFIPERKEATGVTAFDSSGKALPIYKDPQLTDAGQK